MATESAIRLQEGIYFRSGDRPGPAFRLVLLNVHPDATRAQARDAIATAWAMLQRLRGGSVDELQPTPEETIDTRVNAAALTCLLGFGASLFARYAGLARPEGVEPLGPLPFNSLRWVPSDRRTGEADLALQLIAETELAVDRALVELWMLTQPPRSLPLQVVTVYDGSNRDDKRSWLGFHDGLSNIAPDERRGVIEVAGGGTPWMEGGTYMAFLRLAIDLAAWRRLPRNHQEIIVGRDKLSGCPLVRVDPGLTPVPIAGCPVGSHDTRSASHRDPSLPGVDQNLLRQSHIHRANINRDRPPDEDLSNRLYRQGYEFVESLGQGRLRVGLNFVSFQRSLDHVNRILHLPGWLGTTNFGGVPDAAAPTPDGIAPLSLISVIAGGYYAVPASAPPFPGAEIF